MDLLIDEYQRMIINKLIILILDGSAICLLVVLESLPCISLYPLVPHENAITLFAAYFAL